jgi:hypothetical protein
MHDLYLQYIRIHTEWLSCVVFEYKLFYYDLWSFVHLWSGAMIFVVLTVLNYKKRWLKLLFLLSLFEVFEATIIIAFFHIFKPEKSVDVVNDIVNGMIGGFLMYQFFKWNTNRKYTGWFTAFVSAITIAYVWVGSYGYNYNTAFFNSCCINWWALLCWTLGGMGICIGFKKIHEKTNTFYALIISWIIYLIILFTSEYIAYHLFALKETSTGTSPLIFDIIHGDKRLHLFYSIAPVYFLTLYSILLSLFRKHEKEPNTYI